MEFIQGDGGDLRAQRQGGFVPIDAVPAAEADDSAMLGKDNWPSQDEAEPEGVEMPNGEELVNAPGDNRPDVSGPEDDGEQREAWREHPVMRGADYRPAASEGEADLASTTNANLHSSRSGEAVGGAAVDRVTGPSHVDKRIRPKGGSTVRGTDWTSPPTDGSFRGVEREETHGDD